MTDQERQDKFTKYNPFARHALDLLTGSPTTEDLHVAHVNGLLAIAYETKGAANAARFGAKNGGQ